MVSTEVIVPEASVESSASGVHWGAIFRRSRRSRRHDHSCLAWAGARATVSPWTPSSTPPATFGIAAGIWLIITQWLSAGLGGYLAGRLREKWVGVRTDEVLFRDTAHGLLAWALATIIVVALLIVGSAVAGAVAAATPAPAAPVSPEAAEAARKAAISFSFFSSLSFLIGAFIGAVAGALGGYHRDEI